MNLLHRFRCHIYYFLVDIHLLVSVHIYFSDYVWNEVKWKVWLAATVCIVRIKVLIYILKILLHDIFYLNDAPICSHRLCLRGRCTISPPKWAKLIFFRTKWQHPTSRPGIRCRWRNVTAFSDCWFSEVFLLSSLNRCQILETACSCLVPSADTLCSEQHQNCAGWAAWCSSRWVLWCENQG